MHAKWKYNANEENVILAQFVVEQLFSKNRPEHPRPSISNRLQPYYQLISDSTVINIKNDFVLGFLGQEMRLLLSNMEKGHDHLKKQKNIFFHDNFFLAIEFFSYSLRPSEFENISIAGDNCF